MEVFNTWHGMFRLAGVVKLATAVVSMLAVAPLMEILPKLLAVPALTDVLNLKAALSTEQQEKLRMAGQLQESEADRALLQRQKLESLGILAGGIAHDFNNLLGAMQGNVELALLEDSPKRARPYLETLEALMDRGAGLLRQIMAYSGRGRLALCTVHLNQLVQDLTRLLGTSISKKASIRLDLHPGLPALEGDRSQLEQVVMNLVLNASEAIGDQPGVITIATRPERLEPGDPAGTDPDQPLPPGPYVALVVADSGCGMTPEVLERIFEPFFTTKFTGRGLGLAAIHGIVRGHRGQHPGRQRPRPGQHLPDPAAIGPGGADDTERTGAVHGSGGPGRGRQAHPGRHGRPGHRAGGGRRSGDAGGDGQGPGTRRIPDPPGPGRPGGAGPVLAGAGPDPADPHGPDHAGHGRGGGLPGTPAAAGGGPRPALQRVRPARGAEPVRGARTGRVPPETLHHGQAGPAGPRPAWAGTRIYGRRDGYSQCRNARVARGMMPQVITATVTTDATRARTGRGRPCRRGAMAQPLSRATG